MAQVPTPPPNASNNTRQTPVKQSSRLQKTSSNADTLTKDELWRLVVWPNLQQKGWTLVAGSTALYNWAYLRPGKTKSGKRGVDYYEGWEDAFDAVSSEGLLEEQEVKGAKAQALRAKQGKGEGEGETEGEGESEAGDDDDDEDDDATDMENTESIATRTPRTIQEMNEHIDHDGESTDVPIPANYEYQVIVADGRKTMKQIATQLKCAPELLTLVNRCE